MMVILGLFLVLHGLVHLLYFGHSAGYFELKPGMNWPDGAWAFSRLVGKKPTRVLASISMIAAAIGFAAGGAGLIAKQGWGRPAAMGAAYFSSLIIILFWDGKMRDLDGQGGIGVFLNLAILAALFALQRL